MLLLAAFIAATTGPVLDRAYCSVAPEYSFRIDATGFSDADGTCRTISTETDREGWLTLEQDCPSGPETIVLMVRNHSAAVAILEDGREYHLAFCS